MSKAKRIKLVKTYEKKTSHVLDNTILYHSTIIETILNTTTPKQKQSVPDETVNTNNE